jgi:cytoskeletal protein CcmA (bactofilin family)
LTVSHDARTHDAGQTTILNESCRIRGDVTLEGDAVLLGQIDGSFHASGAVHIGASASIRGQMKAGTLTLEGEVKGDVFCDGRIDLSGPVEGDVVSGESIAIAQGGRVVGTIYATAISIAEGGSYRGQMVIGPDATAEAARHLAEREKRSGPPPADAADGVAGVVETLRPRPASSLLSARRPRLVATANGAGA